MLLIRVLLFFVRNLNLNQNILLGSYFKCVQMDQWVSLKGRVRFSRMVAQMNEQKNEEKCLQVGVCCVYAHLDTQQLGLI